MKLFAVLCLLLLLPFSAVLPQEKPDSLGDKRLLLVPGPFDTFIDDISEKKWEDVARALFENDETRRDFGAFNPEENVYILFLGINDINEIHIVHRDNNGTTDRLVEEENIFFVWVDDSLSDDYEVGYEIKKQQSALMKDLTSMKSWLSGFKTQATDTRGADYYHYYFNVVPLKGVIAPADINIMVNVISRGIKKYDQTLSLVNHEITYFNVALGASAAKGQEKNFLIKNKQLYISDNAKKNWSGVFILGFNLHLPRDVDDFDPSYKVWESAFWKNFHQRLNLFFGFEVSTRPFDNLFAGLGINVLKDIQLSAGVTFKNDTQLQNGSEVGDINSLSDIQNFFPKKYVPQFYFGLAFSTGMVTKMLGIGG